jgi:hypothetical protein
MWNCGEAVGRARKRLDRREDCGWGKTMDVSSSMVLERSAKEGSTNRNRNRNRAIVRRTG